MSSEVLKPVAFLVNGRMEQGLTFEKEAADNMAMATAGTVVPLVPADKVQALVEAATELSVQVAHVGLGLSCRADVTDALPVLADLNSALIKALAAMTALDEKHPGWDTGAVQGK